MHRRLQIVTLTSVCVALTVVLVAQTPTGSQTPAPGRPADVAAFSAALEACTAAKVATPHPFMRDFIIEHTVTKEDAGLCDYRQTMPGDMTMICALSEEGRKQLATEMRNMAEGGSMRGSTSAAPAQWMTECEIETASGQRSPVVSGRGGGS